MCTCESSLTIKISNLLIWSDVVVVVVYKYVVAPALRTLNVLTRLHTPYLLFNVLTCVRARACARACVRAYMRACVRGCVWAPND